MQRNRPKKSTIASWMLWTKRGKGAVVAGSMESCLASSVEQGKKNKRTVDRLSDEQKSHGAVHAEATLFVINKRCAATKTFFHSFTSPSFPSSPSDHFSSFTNSHRRHLLFQPSLSLFFLLRWTSAHSFPPLHTPTDFSRLFLFTLSTFFLLIHPPFSCSLTHVPPTPNNHSSTTTTQLQLHQPPQQLIPQWLAESWCVPEFIQSLFFLLPTSSQHPYPA